MDEPTPPKTHMVEVPYAPNGMQMVVTFTAEMELTKAPVQEDAS